MLTLIEFLKKVNDPRQKSGKRHPLWLILLLVIFGVMFGYLGYRDLEAFGKSNQKLIVKTFNLTVERVPSYSTIRRAMMSVNTSDLVEVFNQWAWQLSTPLDGSNWVSIDGKCLRSTCLNYGTNSQDFVSIVSLFSQSSGLVLRLQKFENKKSSEIKQVQELVKDFPIQGQVFTLDALHCQKETTTLITQSKNDYIVALKRNQKNLLKQMVKITDKQPPKSQAQSVDISHGRHLVRKVSVFDVAPLKSTIFDDSKWGQITSLIKVERSGTRGKKDYKHLAYYISSLSTSAEIFASKIRGHWLIENQLHWVKDVFFQEDSWPLYNYTVVTNFSILKTIALNIYRFLGFSSLTVGFRWLNYNLEKLILVVS
jgi:predicted transposase YbfD/YdcC